MRSRQLFLGGIVALAGILATSAMSGRSVTAQDDGPAPAPAPGFYGFSVSPVVEPPDADVSALTSFSGATIVITDASGAPVANDATGPLPAGTYTATLEGLELPPEWDFAIDCDDDASDTPSSFIEGTNQVSLGIDPGEGVSCAIILSGPGLIGGRAGAGGGVSDGGTDAAKDVVASPVPDGPDADEPAVDDSDESGSGPAGTARLVLKEGRWRITEVSNRAACDDPRVEDALKLKRSKPATGSVRVLQDGRRLVATGVANGRLVMNEVAGQAGRYRGRRDRVRFTWQVDTDDHITATNVVSSGQGCKITRHFDMRYLGD
jgi:hypothetical protein